MNNMLDSLTAILENLNWPPELAVELASSAHSVHYEKGATIFRAGEPADLLYVLLAGEVKSYYGSAEGERLLVGIARGGEVIGYVGLETRGEDAREARQLFSAEALSRCEVAVITRGRLLAAARQLSVQEAFGMTKRVNAYWARMCVRVLNFLTMDVRSRLEQAISEISDKFGIPDSRGKLISLRLSHEDFGELVGASRPMVSKHLKEFSKSRVFFKENGRYVHAPKPADGQQSRAGALRAVVGGTPRRREPAGAEPSQWRLSRGQRRRA